MAKIIIQGDETTVTITETEREDGETVYGLECEKGVWCPRSTELVGQRGISLADAVAWGEVHADCVDHE